MKGFAITCKREPYKVKHSSYLVFGIKNEEATCNPKDVIQVVVGYKGHSCNLTVEKEKEEETGFSSFTNTHTIIPVAQPSRIVSIVTVVEHSAQSSVYYTSSCQSYYQTSLVTFVIAFTPRPSYIFPNHVPQV